MKQKNSISKFRQTGYVCEVCGFHVKTYNGEPISQCLNCNTEGKLKKEWDQLLTVAVKVEDVV